LPEVDLNLWVDASTSWGIGLCSNVSWAAWHLLNGWNSAGWDISWAESIAIELAIMWLMQCGWRNTCFKLNCDNTLVIASFWKGRSRNPAHNESLTRITANLAAYNLSITPSYVQSSTNRADSFSRGILGHPHRHIVPQIDIPCDLFPFIESR